MAIPSSPASGSRSQLDPCALITKAEADAAFGWSFDEPKVEEDASSKTCTYVHTATTLTIAVTAGSFSKANIDAMKQAYGPNGTELWGIGDAAFEFSRIITVLKGSAVFTVGTGAGPAILSEEQLQNLAKTAAGRV